MASGADLTSYFRLEMHRPAIIAHIILMTLAWVVLLPVAVMLSVVKSRLRLPAQLVFAAASGLGALLGGVYSRRTPDMYEEQKHGQLGWVSVAVSFLWIAITLVPNTTIERSQSRHFPRNNNWSSEALLYNDYASSFEVDQNDQHDERLHDSMSDSANGREKLDGGHLYRDAIGTVVTGIITCMASTPILRSMQMLRAVLDRSILVLGFACLVTGVVVYSGSFHGKEIFNGLAHSIKGGIFFWYGLLTFGRWLGCLADYGWAWNSRPDHNITGSFAAKMPTMEFIESAAMCFYGVTNVWLEHLSNPDGTWQPRDLEHVSIAFLFFGGGLLGILINSHSLRNLIMSHLRLHLDSGSTIKEVAALNTSTLHEQEQVRANPMPAILVFLLGFMMSSHHQGSKVSSMLHTLWGQIFMAGALSRVATYITLHLRPSNSVIPQRPLTEVITSVCMTAGGLLLMLSNRDTIAALEYHDLDAMFVFTNVLGITAILMAWLTICLGIKGWAEQKEALRRAN